MSTDIKVDQLDFAFQPIVDTKTGEIYAVEALLRNTQDLGFNSIQDFFDSLNNNKILFKIDIELRHKAIEKFKQIDIPEIKLFYNLDNRILTMPDFQVGETSKIMEEHSLPQGSICFEITEHHSFEDEGLLKKIIKHYKKNNFDIAIDDFGTGVSGLHLLYISDANFIKLDKFFIKNIHKDSKKRLFSSSIIEMAHIMGCKVIAEGIETKEDYYTCKDINVDYIQGYLISKPSLHTKNIKQSYSDLTDLFKKDRRVISDNRIENIFIDKIAPLNKSSTLHELFIYFKENPLNTFAPITNDKNSIIGVIYEVDIKALSYSQYGLSLAKNLSIKSKLKSYIKPILKIDISWGIDKALEIFNMQNDSKGIFVTKNNEYYGFINLNNLLSLSYKRNIEIAQNQNPLTKLPGNNQIDDFINYVFKKNISSQIVYFDFNDFKPFNDYYGFRQGDRAILIFSEVLQKNLSKDDFIAHLGGDDFFVGFKNKNYEDIFTIVQNIQKEFELNVSSLYSKKDLDNSFILAKDRFGISRKFNLLTVCAAIINISPKSTISNFYKTISNAKKDSKKISFPLGLSIYL